ncbi:MAG: aldehyde ferredoxin oxidoreductase C-terminal domain-containing protein [Pseudomonadota bacterium]
MEYYGYSGRVLYVDLSTGNIRKEPLDMDLAHQFIGGPGVGLNLLLDVLKPNIDPLSPENALVFGTGPLLGTLVPGSGKCYLTTKYSIPASKDENKFFISASMFGGNRFGSMMKNAGYDHIVITGRAQRPSYLKVIDEDVEICDASHIWGKDVYEAGRILRDQHKGRTGRCGTFVIGPAGENLVRFSLGWTDDWYNAGRFAGAVAGAKNLKAIVTLGNKGIRIANRKRFMEVLEKKRQEILSHPDYRPTAPFGMGRTGKLLTDTFVGIKGCNGGMCACKSIHEVKDGPYKGEWFGGTFAGMPALIQMTLQIEDYGAAFKLLGRMNRDGLCLSTSMNMLSFVTKLYERGVLSQKDMGGLELKVGDSDFYLALLEKIVHRQDIGDVMAEGWYPLCEKVGVDPSTDYETGCAITKGIDLLVDARIWPSLFKQGTGFSPCMGLGSVVHAKAKHTHSATYWSHDELSISEVRRDAEKMGLTNEEIHRVFTEDSFDTGRLEKYGGEAETTYNAIGICDTAVHWQYDPMRDIPWLSEAYSAATGLDITPRELLRAGERIFNLERLFNVREGFTREDDRIPPIYLQNMETPLPAREGERYLTDWFGRRLTREDLQGMLDAYYEERGWDIKTGIPTRDKLTELGLEEQAEMLKSG